MKRSISALVLGLICVILNLFLAYAFYFIGGLAFGLSGGDISFILIFSYVFLVCAVVGFVGSFFCINKANIGAIILLVAFAPSTGILIYLFISSIINGSLISLQLLIAPITILLMTLCVICAFKAKSINKKIVITNNASVNDVVNVNITNTPENIETSEPTVEISKPSIPKDEK